MIDLEHSPLGGSGAKRFLACSGSFLLHRSQLESDEFEQIESPFARLGTAAHALAAMALSDGREPFEYIGHEIAGFKVGWPNGIQLNAVSVYVNECRQLIDTHKDSILKLMIEETIALPNLHPLLRGTVDFGLITPTCLILRDYKNGEGVGVSAIENTQLLYYAFLMVMAHPSVFDAMPDDFTVSLGIVQPNFYGIFEAPDVWETTLGYVKNWGLNTLLPCMVELSATQDIADSDFVLGDHCQFCPVMLDCPKMQRVYQEFVNASEDFVLMLTDAELDHYFAQREHVRRFISSMESTVYARLVSGKSTFTSAKLVEKQVRRLWRPGAEEVLVRELGDKNIRTAPELKSPAQIERLSSRAKELVLEWGYKPTSDTLTIAPMSDSRPEAKPRTNESVFAAHTDRQTINPQDF